MLATSKIIGFLAVTDAAAARQFYEGKLGLAFVSDDPFAMVFDANGTHVRLQKVQKHSPQPFTALGWEVKDIVKHAAGLAERGIAFERFQGLEQDKHGIWTAPGGARIAWFKDPAGNLLSLSQHP